MISISWFSALVVGHLVLFLLSLLGHVGVGSWCTVISIICCCALVDHLALIWFWFLLSLLGVGPWCAVISIICCSTLVVVHLVQFSMSLLGVGPSCTVISITCCSTLVAYFCFGSLKYFVSFIKNHMYLHLKQNVND